MSNAGSHLTGMPVPDSISSRKRNRNINFLNTTASADLKNQSGNEMKGSFILDKNAALFLDGIRGKVLEAFQKSIQSTATHTSRCKLLLGLLLYGGNTNFIESNDITEVSVKEESAEEILNNGNSSNIDQHYVKDSIRSKSKDKRFKPIIPVEISRKVTIQAICDVVLNLLPHNLKPDQLKRFTTFLANVCKFYGRIGKSVLNIDPVKIKEGIYPDDLSITIVEGLLPFHNAKDKQVRFMVVELLRVLLFTLCEAMNRNQLYSDITKALKERAFDKCPFVRERAIQALKIFHIGDKEDDVTQVSLLAMCEDTSPKVREAAVLSVSRYRSIHIRHLIRMTMDVNSGVRKACWEALAGYNIKDQLLFYCIRLNINLFDVAYAGLHDPCETTKNACRMTLTLSWLDNGFNGDIQEMVKAFFSVHVAFNLNVASDVIRLLLSYQKRTWKPIGIHVAKVTLANVLLWRCSVLHFLDPDYACEKNITTTIDGKFSPAQNTSADKDIGPEDNDIGLPSFSKFAVILLSIVTRYSGQPLPDSSCSNNENRSSGMKHIQEKDVVLGENEDLLFIIEVLLSLFEVYNDFGIIAHVNDKERSSISKPLALLLKIVNLDQPMYFVDTVVAALKNITIHHENEGNQIIEKAMKDLYSLLSIPKEYDIGYEDVEAYRRFDEKRRSTIDSLIKQRNQMKKCSRNNSYQSLNVENESVDEVALHEKITTDDAVMCRLCRIAHVFLSCSNRSTDSISENNTSRFVNQIPNNISPFIQNMIQLGQAQCNKSIQALSIQSITLHCLISPIVVHTFVPFLIDKCLSFNSGNDQRLVSIASASGLFDILNEYGPKFFDGFNQPQYNYNLNSPGKEYSFSPYNNIDDRERSSDISLITPAKSAIESRFILENLAASDITCPTQGGFTFTRFLLSLLSHPSATLRHLGMFGFCKLLGNNKVVHDITPIVLARLFIFFANVDNSITNCLKLGIEIDQNLTQLKNLLKIFFQSFAFSNHRHQYNIMEGGLIAWRLLLDDWFKLKEKSEISLSKNRVKTEKNVLSIKLEENSEDCKDSENNFFDSRINLCETHNFDPPPERLFKLLKLIVFLTDAINLKHIRDIDPAYSSQVAQQSALDTVKLNNSIFGSENGSLTTVNPYPNSANINSNCGSTTRYTTLRLWRALGNNSLHERLACELLCDISLHPYSHEFIKMCISELTTLRFYKRDKGLSDQILAHHIRLCNEKILSTIQSPDSKTIKTPKNIDKSLLANVDCDLSIYKVVKNNIAMLEMYQNAVKIKLNAQTLDDVSAISAFPMEECKWDPEISGASQTSMSFEQRLKIREGIKNKARSMLLPINNININKSNSNNENKNTINEDGGPSLSSYYLSYANNFYLLDALNEKDLMLNKNELYRLNNGIVINNNSNNSNEDDYSFSGCQELNFNNSMSVPMSPSSGINFLQITSRKTTARNSIKNNNSKFSTHINMV